MENPLNLEIGIFTRKFFNEWGKPGRFMGSFLGKISFFTKIVTSLGKTGQIKCRLSRFSQFCFFWKLFTPTQIRFSSTLLSVMRDSEIRVNPVSNFSQMCTTMFVSFLLRSWQNFLVRSRLAICSSIHHPTDASRFIVTFLLYDLKSSPSTWNEIFYRFSRYLQRLSEPFYVTGDFFLLISIKTIITESLEAYFTNRQRQQFWTD